MSDVENCYELSEMPSVISEINGYIQNALEDRYQALSKYVNIENLISEAVRLYCINTNGAPLSEVDWGTLFKDLYSELERNKDYRNVNGAMYVLSQLDSRFAEPSDMNKLLMKEREDVFKKSKKQRIKKAKMEVLRLEELNNKVKNLESQIENLYKQLKTASDELNNVAQGSSNIQSTSEFKEYMDKLAKLEKEYSNMKSMIETLSDNIVSIVERLNTIEKEGLRKSFDKQLDEIAELISSLTKVISRLPIMLSHAYSEAQKLSNTIGSKTPYLPSPPTWVLERYRKVSQLITAGPPFGNFPPSIYPAYGVIFKINNGIIPVYPVQIYQFGGEACPGFIITVPPYTHETYNRLAYYVKNDCGVEVPLFALGSIGQKIGESMLQYAQENKSISKFTDYTLGPDYQFADLAYSNAGKFAIASKNEYDALIDKYKNIIMQYGIPAIFVFCDKSYLAFSKKVRGEALNKLCDEYILTMIKSLLSYLVR